MNDEDRKLLVEQGLKQFHQSEEFRELLTWVLIEHEKAIKHELKEQIEKESFKSIPLDRQHKSLSWFLSLLE